VQQYVVADGIGRTLEVGAKLGFHGFSANNERIVLLNEAFDAARVISGLIVQYANEMTGIDLSLLSELVSIEPANIRIVTTPRELRALSIKVAGTLPPRPAMWALNACAREVERLRPINDMPLAERISQRSKRVVINNMAELKRMLLADMYPGGETGNRATREALANLPDDEFLRLVADTVSAPKFPVERIGIQRGAGFYFDQCYALEDSTPGNGYTLMISSFGGNPKKKYHGQLGWYPDQAGLW